MKVITISVLLGLMSFQAFAQTEAIQEVECKLEILNLRRATPYVLFGSIKERTGSDYLTLEPNSSSRAHFSARILLTGNYDPVTLHPRGNTVGEVARGDLAKTEEVRLEYFDAELNDHYILECKNI